MGDWPTPAENEQLTPLFISTWGFLASGGCMTTRSSAAASAWTTANAAVYIPFWLPFPYTVRRLFWGNGSAVTINADIGIYTQGGVALVTAGSTAQSGASAPQFVTPAALPIVLSPGGYFLGFSMSNTTANCAMGTAMTALGGRLAGCFQQTSALPLPTPSATFATYAATLWPLIGLTRTASGF